LLSILMGINIINAFKYYKSYISYRLRVNLQGVTRYYYSVVDHSFVQWLFVFACDPDEVFIKQVPVL